jgi:hypothetical protein
MADMSGTTDLLEKYRRSAAPKRENVSSNNKIAYAAFESSPTEKRYLELRPDQKEASTMPSYGMLAMLHADWETWQGISLVFGSTQAPTMVVLIRGKNLESLSQGIKDWKVHCVTAFDARIHAPVTDANLPFVEAIEIDIRRPEPPPPMNQRH